MKFILAKNGATINPARVDYFQVCFNNINRKYDVVAELAQDTLAVADFPTEDEAKKFIAQLVADLNKPVARWIKTCCGDTVNLDIFGRFEISKHIGAGCEEYCVVAYDKYDGEKYTLQVFNTEDAAKNYIAQLVADLNKPAAHWIKPQRSELLDIDSYNRFQIQKYTGAGREDYCVVGYGKYDGEPYTIQVFNTVDDAQNYLDDLLENLNS